MKKIAFILGCLLYVTPSFAQSLYYMPLGMNLHVHNNRPPYDYAKLHAFIRMIKNPHYVVWIEGSGFYSDRSSTQARYLAPNSVDIGFAGRYHFPSRKMIVGSHCFFIFQHNIAYKAFDLSSTQTSLEHSKAALEHSMHQADTASLHLTDINPGFELAWPKYHTAIYTHVKIPLSSKKDAVSMEEQYRYKPKYFKWGGEITSKIDIPSFYLGFLRIAPYKLTIGMYGNQYTNHPFDKGLLGRLEVPLFRFFSVVLHKDQLTPTSLGFKIHFGWQDKQEKGIPYYLYNAFDRHVAYHLFPKPAVQFSPQAKPDSVQSTPPLDATDDDPGIILTIRDPNPLDD